MGCEHKESCGFYHPRQPQKTPFYQLVERFYPQFEAVYAERYQERFGFWRPIMEEPGSSLNIQYSVLLLQQRVAFAETAPAASAGQIEPQPRSRKLLLRMCQ